MKPIPFAVLLALFLWGLSCPTSQAQSAPAQTMGPSESKRAFRDLPLNDPAYVNFDTLQSLGLPIASPYGTIGSRIGLDGYGFGVATARLMHVLTLHPTAAQKELLQVQQETLDKLQKNPKAATALLALINEFEPEILALHQDVMGAKQRIYQNCPSLLPSNAPPVSATTLHPFANVPADDPAWDGLMELQQDGIILHLPAGTDLSRRSSHLTRYEIVYSFFDAVLLLARNGEEGSFSYAPPQWKKPLETQLQHNPNAVKALLVLINEFQPELVKMGGYIPEAKQRLFQLCPFGYIPYNDPAFIALGVLQDAGLVEGYDMVLDRAGIKARSTTNTYSGNGQMTPYQFAVAVTEAYPLPLTNDHSANMPADNAAKRKRADAILSVNPFALQALQSLTEEFRPMLDKLGQDVPTLNTRLAALAVTPQSPLLAAKPFLDVPKDHWAFQAVEDLRTAGVVAGYHAGTFRADSAP